MLESGIQNPFEDNSLDFLALKNAQGQFSLWPKFKTVPQGWDVTFGPAHHDECMEYISTAWTKPLTSVD